MCRSSFARRCRSGPAGRRMTVDTGSALAPPAGRARTPPRRTPGQPTVRYGRASSEGRLRVDVVDVVRIAAPVGGDVLLVVRRDSLGGRHGLPLGRPAGAIGG